MQTCLLSALGVEHVEIGCDSRHVHVRSMASAHHIIPKNSFPPNYKVVRLNHGTCLAICQPRAAVEKAFSGVVDYRRIFWLGIGYGHDVGILLFQA